AVGSEAEDPSRFAPQLPGQGQAGGQRQPMAQASGGEKYVAQASRRRGAGQPGTGLVEGLEGIVSQPAERPKGDVEGAGGMALGKDELVLRAHHVMIEGQQDV